MKTADVTRTSFAVLFLAALVGGSLWILKPFVGPTIWATMVVVATWPVMLRVQAAFGGRRGAAVAVMTLLLVLLFAVPLALSIATLVENADRIVQTARELATWRPSREAPGWLLTLPVVGGKLAVAWEQAVAAGLEGLIARVQPYAGGFTRWFVGEIGDFGSVALQFMLTIVIAAVMYARGEVFGGAVRAFAGRLAGARGEGAVTL
ncbi:AI-2E family transporter, partial [Rubrivivax gelatinosus]